MPTVAEWLEAHAASSLARQRATVDTARLLVTFATGLAATVVATNLQVQPNSGRADRWSCYLLGVAAVLALIVFTIDRIREPNVERVLRDAAAGSWAQDQILQELRTELIAAPDGNNGFVQAIKMISILQTLVALISGAIAVVALL